MADLQLETVVDNFLKQMNVRVTVTVSVTLTHTVRVGLLTPECCDCVLSLCIHCHVVLILRLVVISK